MPGPVYLDYNATTPVDPRVVEEMLPFFGEHFGNPSSEHVYGWAAQEAVEYGRERVAGLLGCEARNLTFTSGATEAINLALKGSAAAYGGARDHVVTVATEHKAVLEACASLERAGRRVSVLPVEPSGLVDVDRVREAVTDRTLLVAVMAVNSETGILQPLGPISEIAHSAGALMMTDATQAPGKVAVDVDDWGIDLLTLSAHKMYGPKGAGVLYRRLQRPRVRLLPILDGGGHEAGLRSGTPNVPSIVGMGKAAQLVTESLDEEATRLEGLRNRLEHALLERIAGSYVNGIDAPRVPNTTSITFPGARMRDVFPRIRGVAASTGSACQTTSARPSHVLTAMGLPDDEAFSTIRLSVGRFSTEREIEVAIVEIASAVEAVTGNGVRS